MTKRIYASQSDWTALRDLGLFHFLPFSLIVYSSFHTMITYFCKDFFKNLFQTKIPCWLGNTSKLFKRNIIYRENVEQGNAVII